MKFVKHILPFYILPILAVIATLAIGCDKSPPKNQLCNQTYALCTSAPCIPQPGLPNKAICFCDVEEGYNMSTSPCDTLRPSTDENGIVTIFSTFSLKQQLQDGKKGMKCPSGTPWTWCLNKCCTVNPDNPKQAICMCDVMRTGEWTTFGGDCDTSTCKTAYWSGAPISALEEGNDFLSQALNLDQSPVKWCPIN